MKILIISECSECKYLVEYKNEICINGTWGKEVCTLSHFVITDDDVSESSFPSWCLLKNTVEEAAS